MGVEDTPPDLVMRAMGRLGQKVPVPETAPVTKKDAEVPQERPSESQTEILQLHRVADSALETAQDRVAEEKGVVEISPAAMAAHGLFSLASKNSRSVEEFRVIKHQVLGMISKDPSGAHGDRNRLLMVTSDPDR